MFCSFAFAQSSGSIALPVPACPPVPAAPALPPAPDWPPAPDCPPVPPGPPAVPAVPFVPEAPLQMYAVCSISPSSRMPLPFVSRPTSTCSPPLGQCEPASLNFSSEPGAPASPWGPCGPGGPCGPASPWGPCGPELPCEPCGPASPCGPCGPASPCGPCGPVGREITVHWPCTHASRVCVVLDQATAPAPAVRHGIEIQ